MTSDIDHELAEARGPKPSKTVSIAIFVLVVAAVFPFLHPLGGQQISRYALTAAVWDHSTIEITRYSDLLFRDGASRDGAVYSDKAPGQPLLAVPFYGLYRLGGGRALSESIPEPDFGLWWLTLWMAGVPAALLCVLMYWWASDIEPRTALAASMALAFGSLLLVYSTLLYAHVLAAVLGLGAYLFVRDRSATQLRLVGAGMLAGLGTLVEYPLALIVAIVVVAAFVLHGRRAWLVVAGGLPFGGILGLYNYRLLGNPFTVTYQWNIYSGVRDQAADTFEIFAGPSFDRFIQVLFSERGLLVTTPVVAIAVAGAAVMWRRGWRLDVVVGLLCFFIMLCVQFAWGSSFAGGAGPRYVIPGLAFLAAPLAVAWQRWRLTTTFLALIGVLTFVAATVTVPQLGSDLNAGMADWLRTLFAGRVAPTLYTEAVGSVGWFIHAGIVGLVGYWLYRARDGEKHAYRL